MRNFEQATFQEKPQPKNEAILKIEKILKSGEHYHFYEDFIERLYPELFKEERQKFKEKWKGISSLGVPVAGEPGDSPIISIVNTEAEEYWQDQLELNKKFGEFISQKSPQEILARAREIYTQYLEKKSENFSGEDIRENFYKAYEIGRIFLTKQEMEKASQECLDFLWQKVEMAEDKKERFSFSAKILYLPYWFREAKPKLNFEQRGKLLAYLTASGFLNNEERAKVFSNLVVFRKIKPRTPEGKGKKTIAGLKFIREAALKEVNDLISGDEEEKARDLANFFEKRNVLDTDKDADLFDKLTKKNK